MSKGQLVAIGTACMVKRARLGKGEGNWDLVGLGDGGLRLECAGKNRFSVS